MPSDQYMEVEWTYSDNPPQDFAGFVVKKDTRYDGNFDLSSPVLSKTVRSYQDPTVNYSGKNYYQVCALDTAGNMACAQPIYGFINDTIPPAKPIGLSGDIDASGIVTLHWSKGLEKDLSGYNIYFSNRKDGVYTILTSAPVRDTSYRDTITLETLTEDIYYSIVAVDLRSNMSPFSDKVRLTKPDTIAPGPAVFSDYLLTDSSIIIRWKPSSSHDLMTQELWRGTQNEKMQKIASWSHEIDHYEDTHIKSGTKYVYQLLSIDDSNHTTPAAKKLSVKAPVISHLANLKLTITKDDDKKISVSYHITSNPEQLSKVVIYKSIDGQNFRTWKVSNQASMEYIDQLEKEKKPPVYKARVWMKNGKKSKYITMM